MHFEIAYLYFIACSKANSAQGFAPNVLHCVSSIVEYFSFTRVYFAAWTLYM